MFGDIGWTELLLIGIVALIVIGPEDLPEMFRQLGRIPAKIRAMSREFQRAMDQAAKESGVNDVARDLKSATSAKSLGLTAVKEAADKFEKWDPLKPAARAAKPAAAPAAVETAATPAPATIEAAPKAEGPETQALRAKQAQRKAILRDTADRLKAVNEAPATPPAVPAAPKPASSKPAAARKPKAAAETAPAAPRPPRAPRKKKAPEA